MFVYILNFFIVLFCFRDFLHFNSCLVCGVGFPDSVCYFFNALRVTVRSISLPAGLLKVLYGILLTG
jgi:hypothetical protein